LTGDIPITKEQADWSKAQRTRKKQADSVSPTTTDNSSDPYDLPPDARSQNRRSVSAMRSSSSSDKHKLSPSVSAGLAPNQLPVVLRFRGANTFSGLALLDSGCADNWISRRTVRENRIRSDEDHDGGKTYTDVSGNAVQSCGLAKGSWARLGMTVDTCFKIAENPPFDVCFGYKFMLRQSMITFHEHGEPVAALIKGKGKASAGERQSSDNHAEFMITGKRQQTRPRSNTPRPRPKCVRTRLENT
jgi:hypothetical protein